MNHDYRLTIRQVKGDGDAPEFVVVTVFKNNVDFYFSFRTGIALAIAVVGLYQVGRGIAKSRRQSHAARAAETWQDRSSVPEGRGDIHPWDKHLARLRSGELTTHNTASGSAPLRAPSP